MTPEVMGARVGLPEFAICGITTAEPDLNEDRDCVPGRVLTGWIPERANFHLETVAKLLKLLEGVLAAFSKRALNPVGTPPIPAARYCRDGFRDFAAIMPAR
jgi:hypothetical protein